MADHRVSEIATSRPRLRRDLRAHYQDYRGKHTYVIEDTGKGRFYHVGLPEFQFIQSFDGGTTFAQALARNAATQGEEALTEQQGDQLLRWLIDNELLESESSGQGHRRHDHHAEKEAKRPLKLLAKIFFFKIPLGCPDRFVGRAEPWLGWIFSLPGLLLWAGLLLFTATRAAPHWERFVSGAGQVIAPGGWLYLGFGYAALKILHELGHGVATKRFGGSVPEWGVQMLVFITPLAYVDASASTRFPSRWHRIVVSAAGMYVESALACLCLLGWIATDPGLLNSTLHGAFIAATLVTVLFNLNPLMRFDGYYILGDLLGIPNLSTKGQQWLLWFGKRYLLGMKDLTVPPAARLHPFAVPVYGLLAAVWRVLVWIGITILISLLFKGAGLFLALLSIVVAVGSSGYQFVKFLSTAGSAPSLSRALPRIALIAGLLAGALLFIRVNPTEKALAVVEFEGEERVRAGMRALVVEVTVKDGDVVAAGDLLVRLSNPDEEAARDQLVLELGMARIRARSYYQAGELSAHQGELELIGGLEKKLEESNRYLAAAEVKAPVDGKVIARNLDSLAGNWVEVGEEIVTIAGGEEKELLLSIRQEDIETVGGLVGRDIRLRLRGRSEEIGGTLERIESRATTDVPHPALIATHGGPLAIQAGEDPREQRENDLSSAKSGVAAGGHAGGLENPDPFHQLASPRFTARAVLTNPDDSAEWLAGEWGYVRFGEAERTRLGIWLYEGVKRYLRQTLDQARKSSGE